MGVLGRRWRLKGEIELDKAELKKYRFMAGEILRIGYKIIELQGKRDSLPVVIGKVDSSMSEFPYIKTKVSVPMDEPDRADRIDRQISELEAERDALVLRVDKIREFINSIPEEIDRNIFKMIYMDGKTQREVAEMLGFERSNVAKRIKRHIG